MVRVLGRLEVEKRKRRKNPALTVGGKMYGELRASALHPELCMQVQKRCSAQAKCEGPFPDCTAKREVRGSRRASFRPPPDCTAKREVRGSRRASFRPPQLRGK